MGGSPSGSKPGYGDLIKRLIPWLKYLTMLWQEIGQLGVDAPSRDARVHRLLSSQTGFHHRFRRAQHAHWMIHPSMPTTSTLVRTSQDNTIPHTRCAPQRNNKHACDHYSNNTRDQNTHNIVGPRLQHVCMFEPFRPLRAYMATVSMSTNPLGLVVHEADERYLAIHWLRNK